MIKKDNFWKYWSLALIVILVVSMFFMFWQFGQLDRKGIECRKQPFIYGAKVMTSRQGVDNMFCSCSLTGEDYSKPYSFNQIQENPEPKMFQ